jgi:UDP-glucuronate 4-epimerase
MADDRYLVTGGGGCIGSWVVRELVLAGLPVVALSSSGNDRRLRLILGDAELARVTVVRGDVSDLASLEALARRHEINRVIHLAALQLPFCAADPSRGALVNVVGTVNVFEVARRLGLGQVVYASSAAVYGPRSAYPRPIVPPDAPLRPTSHYGVYKVANEQTAGVYWRSAGVASVGLRPHSVYGPGRDQGMTSKPTLAMIAAAAGRPFRIAYGGPYQFQLAEDVARVFAKAARAQLSEAAVYSIGGRVSTVDEVVETIALVVPESRGRIEVAAERLALPEAFDNGPLVEAFGAYAEVPLVDGVASTIETYRAALARGLLGADDLDRILV